MRLQLVAPLLAAFSMAYAPVETCAQPPAYTFVDVGDLGGGYTYPYGVNSAGDVAVQSRTPGGQYHAALYAGGVLTDLTPGAYHSYPEWKSLNAAGHVYGRTSASGSCYNGFVHVNGTTRVISAGGCSSYITRMNASGQVVGQAETASGIYKAFVYTPAGAGGTLTLISLGGDYSYAYDLNDSGIVVGEARLPSGVSRAFRHDTATGVTTDLGTLGGSYSYAMDVNALGQVTGQAQTAAFTYRAFRWSPGGPMEDMGTLGGSYSVGRHIDASGRVFGQAQEASGGYYRAFRSDGTSPIAIDPAGSTNGYPSLVNAAGVAAGYYYTSTSGNYQPFVFNGTTAYGLPSVYYTNPQRLSENGHVVGYYYPTTTSSYRGFYFSPAVNTFVTVGFGGNYSFLDDVNDAGWAVGWAHHPSSNTNRALLTDGVSMHNIADLVAEPAGAQIYEARHIAAAGHIAGYGVWNGAGRTYLLVPGTLDEAAPTSTASAEPVPNAAGWADADVTVTITAEDDSDGSGVKQIVYSATGAGAVAETVVSGATASLQVTSEGETTITYFARDNAGNEETPKTVVIRIDKTAPMITCASADGAWHGANVTIDCTADDLVSGLLNSSDASFGLITSVAADAESADAATDSRTVCDLAANCASTGPISGNKIDRRRPAIVLIAPAAGTYALNQSVNADFTCADTGAGLGSCLGDVDSGMPLDTATAGAMSFTVTAVDAVGNVATTTVSYTVLKGIPTIAWETPASVVYGTALGATQLNASPSVPGTFVYTPSAGTVLGVGSHALSAAFTPADTANYESVVAASSIEVTQATLTVTAADAVKAYGASLPSLAASVEGFVNGETIAALNGALAVVTTATAASPVGEYPITPSGLSSPNYAVSFVPATLTVTTVPLTITAAPASKLYGAPMPSFAATYGGFVNGDDASDLAGALTFSTAATAASSVGSYPVTPGGLSSANYSIGFVDGSLSVTPAPLNIRADDKAMVLNGALPAFTATYSGLVNGDTPAALDAPVSLATTATGGNPGSFPITATGAVDANYAITFTPGALSVGFAAAGACLAGPGRVILEPINGAGTSVFKRSSTVPAKFRVCDAAGLALSAPGTVTDFRLVLAQAGTVSAVNEPVESTTPFTEFRWDADGQHWIFNMSTKGLAANTTYTFRISLADGTALDFRFGLR